MNEKQSRVLRGLGVVLGWHAVLAGGYVAYALLQPDTNHGGCQGIGWGCSPTDRDWALIVGLMFGVPAVLATLVVSCLANLAIAPRARSGVFAGTAATLGTWLFALAGVFVWAQTRG